MRKTLGWIGWMGFVLILICNARPLVAQEEINLTEEELAKESVLPVVENPQSVRNRNVAKSGAFGFAPLVGAIVNNPFFQSYTIGGTIGYHFNEFHAAYLYGAYLLNHTTQYSKQLAKPDDEISGKFPYFEDFENFPQANILALGMYEFSPLYGKMSFAKNLVLHTDFLLSLGMGTIVFDSSSPLFATTLGIGERFYFGKKWGIRIDLMTLLYWGPYYIQLQHDNFNRLPEYMMADFSKKLAFYFLFSLGFVFYL